MPISSAAITGIAVHGHRWKYEIGLSDLGERLGRDGETMEADELSAIRDKIVKIGRQFLARYGAKDENMRHDVELALDDLEMVDAEIGEVRFALSPLYDQFDYYRIVVVR